MDTFSITLRFVSDNKETIITYDRQTVTIKLHSSHVAYQETEAHVTEHYTI